MNTPAPGRPPKLTASQRQDIKKSRLKITKLASVYKVHVSTIYRVLGPKQKAA